MKQQLSIDTGNLAVASDCSLIYRQFVGKRHHFLLEINRIIGPGFDFTLSFLPVLYEYGQKVVALGSFVTQHSGHKALWQEITNVGPCFSLQWISPSICSTDRQERSGDPPSCPQGRLLPLYRPLPVGTPYRSTIQHTDPKKHAMTWIVDPVTLSHVEAIVGLVSW